MTNSTVLCPLLTNANWLKLPQFGKCSAVAEADSIAARLLLSVGRRDRSNYRSLIHLQAIFTIRSIFGLLVEKMEGQL